MVVSQATRDNAKIAVESICVFLRVRILKVMWVFHYRNMVGFISIECLRTKAKKGSDNFREFRASHHLSPHHPRRHAALRPQSHRHQWFWIAIARHLNIISLIASVVLTLAINLLPALFPKRLKKLNVKYSRAYRKPMKTALIPIRLRSEFSFRGKRCC